MKENPIHNAPDELLIKMLAGETTDDENQELSTWIHASSENKTYFESLQKTWNSIGEIDEQELKEVDLAWGKFEQRTQGTIKPFWSPLMRIAAAVLIGVSIAGGLFLLNTEPEPAFIHIVNNTEEPLVQPLEDGSVVHLKPKASLEYYQSFAQNERHISLEGEAFFEVVKDPKRPFVVQTPQTEIRVLGTSFLVKAMANETQTEVIVSTGLVSFAPLGKEGAALTLAAGKGATYSHTSTQIAELTDPQLNSSSWATGRLVFDHIPMAEVAKTLSRIFDVEITFANEDIKNCDYFGEYRGQDLSEIMGIIGNTNPYTVQKVEDAYIIGGKGCN